MIIHTHEQCTTNVDVHEQDEYDDNANYDDVFDTKHIAQAIEDINVTTINSTYNTNYKLYFDDEYHDFNNISKKCVDNERVSTNTIPHAAAKYMQTPNKKTHHSFNTKHSATKSN